MPATCHTYHPSTHSLAFPPGRTYPPYLPQACTGNRHLHRKTLVHNKHKHHRHRPPILIHPLTDRRRPCAMRPTSHHPLLPSLLSAQRQFSRGEVVRHAPIWCRHARERERSQKGKFLRGWHCGAGVHRCFLSSNQGATKFSTNARHFPIPVTVPELDFQTRKFVFRGLTADPRRAKIHDKITQSSEEPQFGVENIFTK